MNKLVRAAATLLSEPAAVRALLTWPHFSFASYSMLTALRKQGIAPATVVDVGANVGQFAVASARTFPTAKIYSVEPLPDCLPKLRHNTRRLPEVTILPFAVGERSGSVTFRVNAHAHSSSILALEDAHRRAFPDAVEQRTIEVPIRTLDEILADCPLPRPLLLKLDVQGYETQALRGASRLLAVTDHLLLEASFRPMYQGEPAFEELLALAREAGFRFRRPLDWLADDATGEILQMDALFERATETT